MINSEHETNTSSIVINSHTAEMLRMYCRLTGASETEAAEKAIERLAQPYMPDTEPIEAVYLQGASAYEAMAAKNEGDKPKIVERKCYILGECTMLGEPYYRIVVDGQLMRVPKNCAKMQ